uniref:Choline transporter-like protein n=1 Tax=Ciona savignyi TaxID=51511 RepID=H2Z3L8_CIOSA
MGCCGSKETMVQRLSQNDEPATPIRAKKPRDLIFLLLFIGMLGGMGYLAQQSINKGDPSRYLYGVDSWGNVCGRKKNVPIPAVTTSGMDRSKHIYEFNMAFSDIKTAADPTRLLTGANGPAVLCVKECPARFIKCEELLANNSYQLEGSVVTERVCTMPYGWILPHVPVINRCVPAQLPGKAGTKPGVSSFTAVIHQVIRSMVENWSDIAYLVLLSLGISLVMIVLLQLFTRVIVVMIIIIAGVASVAATSFLWYSYAISIGKINETDVTNALDSAVPAVQDFKYLLPLCIAVSIATIIILVLLIWIRKSLCLVIKLFDEASLAVFSMPGIFLQPFITLLAFCCVIAYFLIIGGFIFTVQVPRVDGSGMASFVQDPKMPIIALIAPHIFGCLWMMEFVSGCQQVIIAEAVSGWFFKLRRKKCKFDLCPASGPTLNLVLYNLGSVALGSLVIAIVQFLRVILAYVQKNLKGKESKMVKFILKCMACCLACFEKLLKYVSRNAYICVAMYGDGFCAGAKHAVALLIKNAKHMMALNCVSAFCILLGKVAVVVVTAFIGVAWFSSKLGPTASVLDYIAPLAIACMGSFVTASAFFNVYSMAIDTLFLCFCDDQERNNGSDRPYFSSVALQKYMTRS